MEFKIILWHLSTYPLIFILIIGIFGNSSIFLIFFKENFRTSTIAKYIRILVISDNVILFTAVIPEIYNGFQGDLNLINTSFIGCALRRFLMFYFGDISTWTLTVITIDRLVAVVYPHKTLFWKSRQNTVLIICTLCLLSMLKNIPIWFTFSLVNNTICKPIEPFVFYESKIRPAISFFLYYLIPSIIMTVCTIRTILLMRKTFKSIQKYYFQNCTKTLEFDGFKKRHYSKSLTSMSIAIYILFIILLTPSILIWTLMSYLPDIKNNKLTLIFFSIANILVFSHHALNFYIFFLFGPRFRKEVMAVFNSKYSNTINSREFSTKENHYEVRQNKEELY